MQTTRFKKKPIRNFRILHYGKEMCSAESWIKKNLAPEDFLDNQDRSNKPTYHVNKAYQSLVRALGVDAPAVSDAAGKF